MGMTPKQAKQLGELIATARARKGRSVRGLAEHLGVSFSWLAKLEAGVYTDPAPLALARVASALGISLKRIDRLTRGALSDGLPEPGVYFRTKLDLSPEQVEKIERYIERLRRAA